MPNTKEQATSNVEFAEKAKRFTGLLDGLRKREMDDVIPFMNGDFTAWDLYLASTAEYTMRLIDGFKPMLETRNFVCVSQLLRAQIGVCLRTFALFVAEDQDEFLKVALEGGRIDKLKDNRNQRMTDKQLSERLTEFDPDAKTVYDYASGFVHFSLSILPVMGIPKEDLQVIFNFGGTPNDRNNTSLIRLGEAFIHYVDLHAQMLEKVIVSDDWYATRIRSETAIALPGDYARSGS